MRNFSRIFIAAFLLLSADSIMLAGTITGQLQLPSAGQGIRNNTVTFTLTQPAAVAGTATIVTAPWSCWTDTSGNIVGLPGDAAIAAPVLTSNLATGSLASGTYFVKYTWKNGTGESQPSAERNLVLSHIGTLIVQAPASVPAAATSMQIYIGTSPSGETLQGSVAVTGGVLAGNYSQPTPLVNGAAVPSSNTSACSIRFNDELTPSYTGYNVTLFNSSGAEVQGFRQKWYLAGGISGTINLSSGTPLYAATVVYPQAIVATPIQNAQQSINGPLNLNGWNLLGLGGEQINSAQTTGADFGASVAGKYALGSLGVLGWTIGTPNQTCDTGWSRASAGVTAVGNCTQGDSSGTIKANTYLAADGSVSAPGFARAAGSNSGMFFTPGGTPEISTLGAVHTSFKNTGPVIGSDSVYGITSTTDPNNINDVGLSRISAGTLALGNGTQGDTSGLVKLGGISMGGASTTANVINAPTGWQLWSAGFTVQQLNSTGTQFLLGINQGAGFKHQRFGATCTTTASAGATCLSNYTWTSAFADANYTVVCSCDIPSNGTARCNTNGHSASGVQIILTSDGLANTYGGVECIAVHD